MRKLLFVSGILLIVSAVGVFIGFLNRAPLLLGMRWDQPWLIEHATTIPMVGLWCFAIGCWCLCAGALTYPRVRSRAAFLPFGAAVVIMLLTVFCHVMLRGAAGYVGPTRVHYLRDTDGVRWTAVTRSGLSPYLHLWRGEGAHEWGRPDLEADTDCWDPWELRESGMSGRFLLVGRRREAGALLDLNVPSVVGDDGLSDLEPLRAEFGADVNLVPRGE